jgi:hypothetical protein
MEKVVNIPEDYELKKIIAKLIATLWTRDLLNDNDIVGAGRP